MAIFARPTFSEILTRIQADFDSRLGTEARLRRSVLYVIAFVLAGAAHGLYGFISWLSLQIFPDTAEREFQNRWGAIWGVERRTATKASGDAAATGTDGTIIPEGTLLQRADGEQFESTDEVTIASGTIDIPLTAVQPGLSGNTDASITLTFVSPISGIDVDAIVTVDGLTGGTDTEADSDYLARLLDRIQQPPHGGSENDYLQWAKSIPGVTRAWVYGALGTVTLYFMMDNTYANGIPQPSDVALVQSTLNELKPVTADLTVLAPTASPINFNIDLNVTSSDAIKAAITESLKNLILRDAEPGGTIYLSRMNEAISIAAGEFDHVLIAPVANVTASSGAISTLGTITWS